jgi:uncharacterized protein YigA (DUF484 family)
MSDTMDLRSRREQALRQDNLAMRRRMAEWLKNARANERFFDAILRVGEIALNSRSGDWTTPASRALATGLSLAGCRIILWANLSAAQTQELADLRALKTIRRTDAPLSGTKEWFTPEARSFLYLPFARGGKRLGVAAFADLPAGAFSAEDADDYLRRLAKMLSAAAAPKPAPRRKG